MTQFAKGTIMNISNLTRYGFVFKSTLQNAIFDIESDGPYVKFEDVKELLQTAHNNASHAICAYCGESFRSDYCKGCHLEKKLLPCYPPASLCIERKRAGIA